MTVHGFKRLLHAAQMFDSMLQVPDASTTHLYMFLLVPWSFLNAPRIAKQCCFKMAVGMSNTLRCTFFFRICFFGPDDGQIRYDILFLLRMFSFLYV